MAYNGKVYFHEKPYLSANLTPDPNESAQGVRWKNEAFSQQSSKNIKAFDSLKKGFIRIL